MSIETIHKKWIEDPSAVTLIDAHHHFWDLKKNYYPWLSDCPIDPIFLDNYDSLKRNYLPDDYRADARGHNVLKTVHIEAEWNRNDQIGETQWLSDISVRYGMPNAVVAHAWFHTDDAEEIIARQAAYPLVRGIRSKPVTATSPSADTPTGPGTMRDVKWLRGLSKLEKYNLTWDMRVPSWHLVEAADVARSFPRINMVLNHTGFPLDRSEEGIAAWRIGMDALAGHSNVYVKVSEFGLKGQPWGYESNRRVVREAISIFGIERCIFASNWPVVGLRIDYDTLVRSVKRMIGNFSEADQDRFFWRNAQSFYRL